MPSGPMTLVVTSLPYVPSFPIAVRSGTRAIGSRLSSPISTTLSMFGFASRAASIVLPISRTTSLAAATEQRFASQSLNFCATAEPALSTGRIVPPTCAGERLEMVDHGLGAAGAVRREHALLRHDEQHVRVRGRA